MAHKSGGTPPPKQPIIDANQALALLDSLHHWNCTRVNGEGRRGYEVTITHAGKRVRASASSFNLAVARAMAKLRGEAATGYARGGTPTFMRLASLHG